MARMESELLSYFEGERQGALGFGAMGVVACLLALVVWRWAAHYRAMLYPLLIVAAIQIAVCFVIYLRTPAQSQRLLAQLRDAPAAYRAEEGKRMAGVNLSFQIIEIVELVMMAAGLALCFGRRDDLTWFAVGVGLILQGSAMLVGDLTAHRRGAIYAKAIEALPA